MFGGGRLSMGHALWPDLRAVKKTKDTDCVSRDEARAAYLGELFQDCDCIGYALVDEDGCSGLSASR
jgi:hypothetical protein